MRWSVGFEFGRKRLESMVEGDAGAMRARRSRYVGEICKLYKLPEEGLLA